jgi:hypothetical protein
METRSLPLSSRAKPRDLRFNGSVLEMFSTDLQTEVSSRPERTRISCHAALDKAAYAPFRKEGRMNCINATKFHRKSGGAKWRDLLFSSAPNQPFPESTALPFVIPT